MTLGEKRDVMKAETRSIRNLGVLTAVLMVTMILGYLYVNLFTFNPKLIFSVHAALVLFLGAAIFLADLKAFLLFALIFMIPIGLSYHLVRYYVWQVWFQPFEFGVLIHLYDILLALLYGHWMLKAATNWSPHRLTVGNSVGILFLVWILYTFVVGRFVSTDFQYTFYEVVSLFQNFLLYFYLVNNLKTRRELQIVVTALISGMVALGLYMIMQFITGLNYSVIGEFFPPKADGVGFRAGGFTGADVQHAQMLSLALPIALAYYYKTTTTGKRFLLFLSMMVIVGGVMASKSRAAGTAALVGPIIVVGLGALRGWVPSGRVFRTVLFTLLVLMLTSPLIYIRFQQAQVGTGAEGVRAPLVETAFAMFKDNWLLGVGASNYGFNVDKYTPVQLRTAWKANIHSEFLLHLSERGIVGALIYYLMIGAIFIKLWRASLSKDPWTALVSIGILGGMAGSMALRMFHWFHEAVFFPYYCVLLALAVSLEHFEKAEAHELKEPAPTWEPPPFSSKAQT